MRINQHTIEASQIVINPATLAKIMGLDPNNIPEPYSGLINDELEMVKSYENIRGGYRIIEKIQLDSQNSHIIIDDITFHAGKQVVHYLKHAEMLAFFVCTAGREITDRSKKLNADGHYLEGYIADIIGSLLVEAAMNLVHDKLKIEMEKEGLNVTNRYSPGYCHWNVAEQHVLFSMLPENFCGITLSDSALMNPIKSVSGVIGIGKNVRFSQYVCNACPDRDCLYRNLTT